MFDDGFTRRALLKRGFTVSLVGSASALVSLAASPFSASALPVGITDSDKNSDKTVATPRIYSTKEWGARPADTAIVVENHKPTYIVVHHTVDPGNGEDYSKEAAFEVARHIQNLHMDVRKWGDSGQQFTNSRGGFVTEGRHRSLEVLRGGVNHVLGANVGNHNSEVIGIENEGIYSTVDVPEKLWDSLVDLVTYIAHQYGIAPEFIKGHRDFSSTECCGQILYNRLPELRVAVGEKLGVAVRSDLEWPLLKPGDSGRKVLAAQHLLQSQGVRNIPTDGLFGPSTRNAVRDYAVSKNLTPHICYATTQVDETGFLGSDIWPLLTAVSNKNNSGVDKATRALIGSELNPREELTPPVWKDLLARSN
jgi:hypothetical protein